MRELITYYRVDSFGGIDGRTACEDKFDTIENAKAFAEGNDWNTGFRFYKVVMTVDEDGYIEEEEEEIK